MIEVRPLSRDEVRAVDKTAGEEYGMHGLVLMENAGRGCAETILRIAPAGRLLILCGGGNNGGDGFVVARHLQLAGRAVEVLCFAEPAKLSGDAAANQRIVEKAGIPCSFLPDPSDTQLQQYLTAADVLVDALLGTGAKGNPRAPMDRVIRAANGAPATRIAVDIPSGLDCDTGQPGDPCFHADHTCTFVATKIGFDQPAAKRVLGPVHVIGIGVPAKLLRELGAS